MNNSFYNFIGTRFRHIELANLIKKIAQIRRKYFRVRGKYWYLDPISNFGLRLLNEGHYEPDMEDLILDNLSAGDTFVDLGANEGYFSILASEKVGETGKVYSLEPQSRLWGVIAKNISKNHCYNVTLVPYAMSEQVEEVTITLSPSINTGSSTIVDEQRRKFWKKETIISTTLDKVFGGKKETSIQLMKMDIEGYELFALRGARELLKNKAIKNIIVEMHPIQLKNLGQSVEEVTAFLETHGYSYKNGIFSYEA